jgi:predicted RNA methylase
MSTPETEIQQQAYDRLADKYAQTYAEPRTPGFHYHLDLAIPQLLQAVGAVDGLTVLDAGCGEGIVSRLLVGAARVVGIDISSQLIAYARVRDTTKTIAYDICDLSRPLKPHGRIVLNINNPYSAVLRQKVDSYFDSDRAVQYSFGAVSYYHRTMEDYMTAFAQAGLVLQRLYDIQMTEEMVAQLPEANRQFPWFAFYHRFPFMIILDLVKTTR